MPNINKQDIITKTKPQKQSCVTTPAAVAKRLSKIIPILQKVALGDFSENIEIPEKEDEFTELLVALNLMIDDTREIAEKERKKTNELAGKIKDSEDMQSALLNVTEDADTKSRELAEAKAKDDAILASIAEGCIAVNKNGEIILINRTAEKMLGYTSQESIGKKWHEILHREDANGNSISPKKGAIQAALSSSSTTMAATACYYLKKNGERLPISRIVSPIIIKGKVIGAVNIFRDVTREKEIEKMRVDFLSLASHQLRTPLSGTKWLIETIQCGITGKLNPKQEKYLKNIYEVNERMIKLVSDMLKVLVLESGVEMIKKQKISVAELYKDLFLLMKPASFNKKIMLRNELKNKNLSVSSDFETLKSILQCFISNAIGFSQRKQEVVLSTKEKPNAVIFSVKDNGIGIPKDEQAKIFERFYRASNAKEFKPDGTGLGLYIAFMLARKLNGKISFKSEEGRGSTFYLQIPKKAE